MRASHFMVLPAMALNFCLNLGLAVTLMPSVMSSTQWLTSASLFSLVPHYQACQGRTVNCCLPQSCTSLSAFREILKFLRYNLGKCFLLEAFPDSPSLNYPFSHISLQPQEVGSIKSGRRWRKKSGERVLFLILFSRPFVPDCVG